MKKKKKNQRTEVVFCNTKRTKRKKRWNKTHLSHIEFRKKRKKNHIIVVLVCLVEFLVRNICDNSTVLGYIFFVFLLLSPLSLTHETITASDFAPRATLLPSHYTSHCNVPLFHFAVIVFCYYVFFCVFFALRSSSSFFVVAQHWTEISSTIAKCFCNDLWTVLRKRILNACTAFTKCVSVSVCVCARFHVHELKMQY